MPEKNLNIRAHEIKTRLFELCGDATALDLDVSNSLPIGNDAAWKAMEKVAEAVCDLKAVYQQFADLELVKDAYIDHPAYAYPRKELFPADAK